MRLFVAVELAPQVAAQVAACGDELRRRSAGVARARITWVPAERLHVTVRFIGEAGAAAAEAVRKALVPDVPVRPFEMDLAGVGTFPERGTPRVVWAGVRRGIKELVAIERDVSARLERCGMAPEARPYHPHVTLGRVREAGGLRPASWLEGLTDRPFGVSPVDAITLFESRPSPRGHVYRALQRTPLAGGQTPVTSRSGV